MSVSVIIPARYKSSRFEGKPLALINGKPMILHVAEKCSMAVGKENVYVATDDNRIECVAINNGFKAVMTNIHHCCGSERVLEVSELIDSEIIINVQGDEPLLKPDDLIKVIEAKRNYYNIEYVVNCYCEDTENIENLNTPKVVIDKDNNLIYISRHPIKGNSSVYKKQVGIYAFYKNQLKKGFGWLEKEKHGLERYENIEILRLIENGMKVKMLKLDSKYQSVDVPEDIKKVEAILNEHERSK